MHGRRRHDARGRKGRFAELTRGATGARRVARACVQRDVHTQGQELLAPAAPSPVHCQAAPSQVHVAAAQAEKHCPPPGQPTAPQFKPTVEPQPALAQ